MGNRRETQLGQIRTNETKKRKLNTLRKDRDLQSKTGNTTQTELTDTD